LVHELRNRRLTTTQQRGVKLTADGTVVGECFIDRQVEKAPLVELNTVKASDGADRARCVSRPKATNLPLCMRRNVGKPRLENQRNVNCR